MHNVQGANYRGIHRECSGNLPKWAISFLLESSAGAGPSESATAIPSVEIQEGAKSTAYVQVRLAIVKTL